MGTVRSLVLFQMLSEDLSRYLSPEQIRAENIWPDASLKQRASFSLAKSLLKKLVDDISPYADDAAYKKFLQVNESCASWSLRLENSWDEVLCGELKSSLYNFFYPSGEPLLTGLDQFYDLGRCGPGASVGANGNDFYTKLFSSSLSSTRSSILYHYRLRSSLDSRWHAAELFRAQSFPVDLIVEGSRLNFVPKNTDISRLICVEPSLNMYYQLGLGAVLERRLRGVFGLDLSTQPDLNRELSRIGSINDKYCTIDLASASDSMSLPMLREFLPKNVLSWLEFLRSPFGTYKDEKVALNMVSTMGNGFTFPLQTTFFACIVSACMRARGIAQYFSYSDSRHAGNFAVFGDDIIVDKRVVRDVLRLLTICGFTVNAEKTFVEGPFRESCGHDYFQGHDVRGVYVKSLLTPQARYVAINELNQWSARTGIYLPRTVGYILQSVRRIYIPLHESEDAGIRQHVDLLDVYPRYVACDGTLAYKAFVPSKLRIWITETDVKAPRSTKKRVYNPDGLLISFLGGYVRGSTIMLRHKPIKYFLKWRKSSCWNSPPSGSPRLSGEDFGRRWKTAIYINLN